MKPVWELLKRYPISATFYLIYTALLLLEIRANWLFELLPKTPGGSRLAMGEGLMYGILLSFFTAAVMVVTFLLNMIYYKNKGYLKQKRVYGNLCLIVTTQFLGLIAIIILFDNIHS